MGTITWEDVLYRLGRGERSHVIGCCHTAFPPSLQEHPISGWANSLARRLLGLFWTPTTLGHMLTFVLSDESMQRFAQEGASLRRDQHTASTSRGLSDKAHRQPSATCSFPAFGTALRHPRPAKEVAGSHRSRTGHTSFPRAPPVTAPTASSSSSSTSIIVPLAARHGPSRVSWKCALSDNHVRRQVDVQPGTPPYLTFDSRMILTARRPRMLSSTSARWRLRSGMLRMTSLGACGSHRQSKALAKVA